MQLRDADYGRLLTVRDGLRRFHRWSEERARAEGLTAAQHQLLLAIRGHGSPPTIGEVAEHLMLRHHSVVELVDRAERADLVQRTPDPDDHRVVRLSLTREGGRRLARLATAHLQELERLSGESPLWAGLP